MTTEFKQDAQESREADVVRREREAYAIGAVATRMALGGAVDDGFLRRAREIAKDRFPILRTRLRVARDGADIAYRYNVEKTRIEWNYAHEGRGAWESGAKDEWHGAPNPDLGAGTPVPTRERVKLWHSLLEGPWERVKTDE